jgi:hypothetical protein
VAKRRDQMFLGRVYLYKEGHLDCLAQREILGLKEYLE